MTAQLPRWCWEHQRIECSSFRRNTGARCHGRAVSGAGTCRHHAFDTADKATRNQARLKVSIAVREGRLVCPDACELCSSTRESSVFWSINAHHEDYARPLDVIWLCGSCHSRIHAVHGGLPAYLTWLRVQLAGAERLHERFYADLATG